jgi:threonine/homoserine/homoserine lactone efflux protein
LLYLAARIALAPVRAEDDDSAEAQSGLWRGALCQGLNPKAWWVAMSGVSVLVGVGEGQALRLMWFCALSGVICWLSVATWAGLGRVLRPWLAQPARQRVFNWLMAAALLAAVGPLLSPV